MGRVLNGGAAGAAAEFEEVHIRGEQGLGARQLGAIGLFIGNGLGGVFLGHPVPECAEFCHGVILHPSFQGQD